MTKRSMQTNVRPVKANTERRVERAVALRGRKKPIETVRRGGFLYDKVKIETNGDCVWRGWCAECGRFYWFRGPHELPLYPYRRCLEHGRAGVRARPHPDDGVRR
jgi:hypothetical protein